MIAPRRPAPARSPITRRRFLGGLFGACVAAGGYAALIEPYWTDWTRRDMPVTDLPDDLEGATLVHLSDLHAGPFVADAFLIDVFHKVNRLAPAFVVATGDWLSWQGASHLQTLKRVLEGFPRGSRATVGVLGNHDWGTGWRDRRFADAVAQTATEAGVRILRNEVLAVGGLNFAGVDDIWSPGYDPAPLLQAGRLPGPTIGLCHNPDGADHPIWAGLRGWILSGHTHGGQCRPPFLPPPLLPVKNRRYTEGVFDLPGERHLHISRGVGNLLHIRFNARPEVTTFTLRRAVPSQPGPSLWRPPAHSILKFG